MPTEMDLIFPKCKQPLEDLILDKFSNRIISVKIKGAQKAILLTPMLSPDKPIFKLFYADLDTSKQPGNVNFGEEYQHLDVTSKHVETYFKSQRKSQRDASMACPHSALL